MVTLSDEERATMYEQLDREFEEQAETERRMKAAIRGLKARTDIEKALRPFKGDTRFNILSRWAIAARLSGNERMADFWSDLY